ncbi:DMT family transporter [Ruegeria lacuscaerulensis]|uniref:DMT family transporter n=1 Tax=Ruegeria lacuscaerulensis TaxID=55218 RepID=UPI00148182D2|nr:DMT family transporter [Ruegeria lacuscaerulensis]
MPRFVRSLPPTAVIIAIGALVGVSFTLSKYVAIAGITPQVALFWQLLVASLVLITIAVATGKRPSLRRRYLFYYLGAGILGISGPALIGYTVLSHVSTGFYSALVTLSPLFTFAITALVEKRMLPAYRLIGILIGLVGISFATHSGFELSGVAPRWIAIALAGPLLLAMGNVFRSRAYPSDGNPMALAAGTLGLQLILIGLPVLASSHIAPGSMSGLGPIAALFGIGLITALSYVLTFEVQRRTDGVGFAQVGYFATLFGIGFGALAFGEPIRLTLIVALAVLFLGLALTNGHIRLAHFRRLPPKTQAEAPLKVTRFQSSAEENKDADHQ